MQTLNEPMCQCGMLAKWISDPHFPIQFDEVMHEYQIIHNGAQILMRYCFWCGGKLLDSKRDSCFTTPDPDEMAEVDLLLQGANSHEDVMRILGPPDAICDSPGSEFDVRSGILFSRWDQHLRYSTRWKTLKLKVPIILEGRFSYMISGHYLEKPTQSYPHGSDANSD